MLKKLLNLLSDAGIYGASGILSQMIGFFLLPLYTRHLGPGDYGVIAMLAILSRLFIPIASLGMKNAVFRHFNRYKEKDKRSEVLGTGLAIAVLSSIVFLATGQLLAIPLTDLFLGDSSLVYLVRLALISCTLATVSQILMAVFRANRQVKTVAILNIIYVFISVSITIWLVVVERLGVLGVILGPLVGDVLSTTVQFILTWTSFKFKIYLPTWRRIISYGLPFVPHQLQSLGLIYFGQYAVRQMLGMEELGLYSIALRLVVPISFVVNSVQKAWVPFKFQIQSEDDDPASFFRSAFTYYFGCISYLWVGVSLWGPEVLRFMVTDEFHDAALFIPFVGLIPVTQGLRFMLGTGLHVSDDNMRVLPVVSFFGLLSSIVGAYALIYTLGIVGAALSASLSWLIMAGIIYFIAQRRYRISYDWLPIRLFSILALFSTSVGVISQGFSLTGRLFIATGLSILYPLIVFSILLNSASERERMSILWNKATVLMFKGRVPTLAVQGRSKSKGIE